MKKVNTRPLISMKEIGIFALIVGWCVIWLLFVSVYAPDVDPGGPLFMLGACLFILITPFIVLIGLGWIAWSVYRNSRR
jgi:hypothetical protein